MPTRVTYRGPEPQHIEMTFELTKHAPEGTVFHSDGPGCLLVRVGKRKAIGVEYGAIVQVLQQVAPACPALMRDLRAIVEGADNV